MTAQEWNTALYQKMFAEQEKYREWLLSQLPEEILHHAYEYVMREDILLSLEYNSLTGRQAKALEKSPSPLQDIFQALEKQEGSHMEEVWQALEGTAHEAARKEFLKQGKGDVNMPYYPPDQVARAREMDLLTYLQNYEPEMLVPCGPNTYCTREHDSLKISNGKWCWFSRGIGGKSALDYLIKVKEMSFLEAMAQITGQAAEKPPVFASKPMKEEPKKLLLPQTNRCATRVMTYLESRGIDPELILFCIRTDRLYESMPHHNVVFVGQDKGGTPKYAAIRGTYSDFKGEATGSDKRFSFHIPGETGTLHLFESAIDLLSYATLLKMEGQNWRNDHLLSLAGIYQPKQDGSPGKLPLALTQYLHDYPEIRQILLRLDNDFAGRRAASMIKALLSDQYSVHSIFPPRGKDYNDFLCIQKSIAPQKQKNGREI